MSSHRAARRADPTETGRPRRSPARRIALPVAVAVVALAGIGLAGRTWWQEHRATDGIGTLAPSSTPEGAGPDERPVPLSSCKAADDKPRTISLGSLDVSGCIVEVGTTGRRLDAPANIHVAGWLHSSAVPGDPGLAIIDGHSSGRFRDGIFNRIGELDGGSVISVTLGDGSVERFRVTSVRSHTIASSMRRLAQDAVTERSNLALITCGGDYDAADHSFDERVVLLARSLGPA